MNREYVNVKVDREERPEPRPNLHDSRSNDDRQRWLADDDVPFCRAVSPFFGGTYFPPEDRYGRPGFKRILETIAQAISHSAIRDSVHAKTFREQLSKQAFRRDERETIDTVPARNAFRAMSNRFDPREGRLRRRTKVPAKHEYRFLLRYHHRTGEEHALHMITLTLDKMAYGGMYDQVGGGFIGTRQTITGSSAFRKMLYDNALLSRVYLDAYRSLGDAFYRRIAEQTFDFVVREMRAPNGAFYATQDADSEGVEGKFYVWSRDEFRDVVGEDADVLERYFDVTEHGIGNTPTSCTSLRKQIRTCN
jgi:uncharacterized protein YyaL (SSP411 family)